MVLFTNYPFSPWTPYCESQRILIDIELSSERKNDEEKIQVIIYSNYDHEWVKNIFIILKMKQNMVIIIGEIWRRRKFWLKTFLVKGSDWWILPYSSYFSKINNSNSEDMLFFIIKFLMMLRFNVNPAFFANLMKQPLQHRLCWLSGKVARLTTVRCWLVRIKPGVWIWLTHWFNEEIASIVK